jgi:uncharacterized protein (UPF0332 family)
MPYKDLLGQGRLARQPPSSKAIQELFSLAERDIHVAEHTLDVDPDWAFNIAYNAVLQAARAFVLSEGYRTRGADQHATVVLFLKKALGERLAGEIATFDQMRRKRHRAVYEASGRIGAAEAKQAVTFAGEFLEKIRGLIQLD